MLKRTNAPLVGFILLVVASLACYQEEAPPDFSPIATTTPTPTPPSTPTPAIADFGGAWLTNVARLSVVQEGDEVMVTVQGYGDNWNDFVPGVVEGRTIRFEDTTFWGTFSIELSADGDSFVGLDSDLSFCGVRSGPLPLGCGFSGTWELSDSQDTLPPGNRMVLIQEGAQVKGTIYGPDGGIFDTVSGEVYWGKGWELRGEGEYRIAPFTWRMTADETAFSGLANDSSDGVEWNALRRAE
jgi:hypothetical protein